MFDRVSNLSLLAELWTPVADRWWCGHCIFDHQDGRGWHIESTAKDHVRRVHGVETALQEAGVDTLDSEQLWSRLLQWRAENRRAAEAFVESLLLVRGADDFAEECTL